ncbi:DUF2252 domain-containing protein [Solimicrobium silvestre]|uniref:DUF2252 domain-containing protein n=1 Tax=Solimicrobium silvestre TaxID=2099400 RepID=A0A2S9GSW4_9BURK|nr:DUF2252 domain-containing protein [Solimicrobium silvestre]PRC90807.1 hypothetical protein S2091_4470 [Solimicrobium silvestre]
MIDVVQCIADFNSKRDPERVAMKYHNMRTNPFVFLRGTCHLFYERLPKNSIFKSAPLTWNCGDMHLENFGSYKGDNRLAYFDMNDFDEAALAPLSWELVRLLTSILIGAESLSASQYEAYALCETLVDAYAKALTTGKSTWVERETSHGIIHQLLNDLRDRQRPAYLDKRTTAKGRGKNKTRTINIDGKKALAATAQQRAIVTKVINDYASTQPNPEFFEVLDVARRIAGTGSLGVDRFVILVKGKGSPDGNYLLDLKNAMPSTLVSNLKTRQPKWETEAHRVVDIEHRMQSVSMAFLTAVKIGNEGYILRALQPSEDRISLNRNQHTMQELHKTVSCLANIVASAHLRSTGRDGSAIADELIAYGHKNKWRSKLLKAAQECAQQVENDWGVYCTAYDEGAFKVG